MRPGKGRYHSLLGLFSNSKIKGLTFINTDPIGLQTSNLPTSHSPSLLQKFHFASEFITSADDSRAADIIRHCPHLVDLRLGAPTLRGFEVPKIDQAISSLSKLAVLHRYRLHAQSRSPPEIKNDTAPYGTVALRELVDFVLPYPFGPNGLFESALRRSSDTLEVLILHTKAGTDFNLVDALGPFSVATHSRIPLSKLTHLELPSGLNQASLELMASILARRYGYIFCAVLKSLSCQIESLHLQSVPMTPGFLDVLGVLSLKRLYICDSGGSNMIKILRLLNLTQLQVLNIYDGGYNWAAEEILAGRSAEFLDGFMLELPYKDQAALRDIHKEDARDLKGSSTRLARHCVRLMNLYAFVEEYHAITLPNLAR
ncbi:hypothetical protein BGX24_005982 [Mortierella sp. AD032]|nr:hypothetical protein BGX24_005982 [Mortierella sp. AD032]